MRNMSVYCNVTSAFEMGDLDIIQEVITEDRVSQRHSGPSLPGPPPPPTDLLCPPQDQSHRILCPPQDQNHRIHGQTTSPASQPVLVARGTASRPPCSFPQRPSCTKEMASGHPNRGTSHLGPSRRGRSSVTSKSPEAPSSCTLNDTELLERILEKPDLVIVEQPKERGMRFRYECEGRSAGSILGASSTETTKTQPAIEIQGPIEHIKKVTVTVSLVTKDIPYRPHPHCLVGKDCPEGAGICLVSFKPPERRHSFGNLGIQCVRRKELDASLEKRRGQNIDPFKTGHSKSIEDMDMNVVRLCFQCELEWEDGRKDSLSPVVSNPIYDKKATTTSQLKITCLNLYKGPCTGKTEIYMLCDKVQKDDIEIIFKRGTWEAKGEFAQTDVHRQIAIVFKSPPYQEQDITEEVEVNVVLRRLSDRMDSEAIGFTYLPHNPDPYEVKRKSKIKTDISLKERPCVAALSPATVEPSTSQLFHFPVTEQPMLVSEERLPPASAVVDNNYSALDNILSNQTFDGNNELNLINQLLEMPALQAMLSDPYLTTSMFHGFDQAPDASANFANFNPNLGPYPQDFSQYNDLTFSHLVSESQAQTENLPQDSPSNMLQVKIEEDQ